MTLEQPDCSFDWVDVDKSTNVARYKYEDHGSLTVEFLSGATYEYEGVPITVAYNMRMAQNTGQSVGKFLGKNIIGKYEFRQLKAVEVESDDDES